MVDKIHSYQMVLKSIRYNKRKSVLSILTIIMAVSLLFVVFTYLYSSDKRAKADALSNTEAYHAEYLNLSNWQIKKLENNHSVKIASRILLAKDIHIVDSRLSNLQISTKLLAMENAASVCSMYLGRTPEKEDEIVLEKWVMEAMKIPIEINQKIELSLTMMDESGEKVDETMEFTLVGIRNNDTSQRLMNISSVLLSEKFVNSFSQNIEQDLRIVLSSNYDCTKKLRDMGTKIGIQDSKIDINVEYMDAYNISLTSILKYIVIVLVIIFIASMVIYNIFSIYMIQKIKLYGTMKAVGFTKRQQAIFIIQEGIILAVIGGILGLLFGVGLSSIFTKVLGSGSNLTIGSVFSFSPAIMIFCFLTGIAIVLIGIYKPMQAVLKMSEIEAMRYNSMNTEMQSFRDSSCEEKLTVKSIVYKCLSRHRKRTLYHMGAIILTGGLFLVVSTIVNSINIDEIISNSIHGDFSVQLTDDVSRDSLGADVITDDMIKQIDYIEGVESIDTVMYERLNWEENDAKQYLELTEEYVELGLGYSDMDSIFYGYSGTCLQEVIDELKDSDINMELMKNNNVAIVVKNANSSLKLHDKVKFMIEDGESNNSTVEFEIIGIIDDNITYRGYKAAANDFIIHQERFNSLSFDNRVQRVLISAERSKIDEVRAEINNSIVDKNEKLALVSYDDLTKEYSDEKSKISISAYSFIILLFLISMFNLINSTFANILSRKREIGVMQAIGLTNTQLNQLLQMENLLIVIASCVIATIIGIPVGYGGFLIFRTQASYATYSISAGAICFMFGTFIAVQFLVTYLAIREINRDSTIERIRYIEM